ncbi:KxYKxGKxW signal peptide domain-containing protein [Weissella confusa]|uniref:KxYKxGKxW signal peptide domain-containing protein n=1 Tax=Weissella confusa TaxID=1583 RepID=UPI0022E19C0D|nr:KxYKxGKxW signal peptide domain-containing protein [Weissella confusa]
MRQMNINKGNYEVKSHYKMYKAGKRWVVAGMATVSLLGGLLMLSTDASADNVDAVVPASESSVTTQVSTPTDSVVLDHASASVAPASSVSAEVSASSASSVAPVSVSTAASVVSADASLSASQSLASSFVVPAEAVKVQDDLDSDGNVRKAYALADAQGATMTQMPHLDSAGTIADVSVSNVASVSASNAALFSDKGSAQVSQDFKNTGDAASFSNVPTNNLDLNKQLSDSASSLFGAKNIFNNPGTVGNADSYASMGVDSIVNSMYGLVYTNTYYTVSASLSAAKKSSDASAILSAVKSSVRESISPAYTSYFKSIYADAGSALSNIINQTNAIPDVNTLPVKDANLGDKIHWTNLVPSIRNEAGTLSFNSQMDMNKYFIIQGGYRMVNVLDGQVLKEKATGGQAIGLAMLPVSPDKMGTVDALKAGVAKTLNVNDAILNMPNGVFAGHDLYVTGTGDVNTKLAHIRTTDATGALGTATYDTTKSVTSPLQGGTNISTDTTSFASNELSNGVFFTVIWNPASSQDGKATGTLTYVEYNSFADMTADASSLVKTISAKPTHASGFVQSTLTLDDAMAVGLYGTNGGNASAMFGGISYFEGTHAVATVNVSYTFNDVKILPDTTINAVAGESIQIKNGKQDDDSKMVKGYDAPTGQGFAISADSKLSVVASDDAQLVVKYVVDKQGFQQNVETATKLAGKIKDQITTAEAQRDAAPEKDKAVIQIAIDQMQAELNNLQGEDGKSGLIGTLTNATSDSTLDDLKTVDAVVGQYNSVQTQMTDITALGDRVSKLVNAVDALLDKEDADANAARDAAKLLGDSAEKSVAKSNKQFSDKVQKAQTDLDTTMADPNSKASDIEHATAVLLADVESESVEHGTDGNVQELLKKVEQAVANGTTDEINEATAKLKIADATVVPANIADNTDVAAAKTAVDKALATSPLDQKQLNESKANYDKAVSKANEALKDAKDAAGTTEENLKHADADTVSKMKKVVDTAVATGTKTDIEKAVANLKVADDTAVVPSTLSDDPALKTAKQAINDAIQDDTFNQTKLNEAKTAYDKALSDAEVALATEKEDAGKATVKHDDDANVTKMKEAVNAAIATGTKTDIATAVANMRVADDTAEVPTTLSDDPALKTAKQAINDAIQDDTFNQTKLNEAKTAYDKALSDAEVALATAKEDAGKATVKHDDDANVTKMKEAVNVAIATGTKTDIATAVANMKVADDTAVVPSTLSDDPALKTAQQAINGAIQDDTFNQTKLNEAKTAYDKALSDAEVALTTAKEVAGNAKKAIVNGGNQDVADHEAAVDEAVENGTASDIAKAVAKLQIADATVVPTNVSDDDVVKAAKKAVDDALKNDVDVTTAEAAYGKAVEQANKKLDGAKQNANDDMSAWNKDVSLYADQDTNDIQKDVAKLNELVGDKTATKSKIDDAREQLRKDIAVVSGARGEKVNEGNAVAKDNEANSDDEVKLTVDNLKKAIATGTKTVIDEAINKVKTAVDTIVAVNISDSDDVKAAKTAVNDILNATGLNADELTKAVAKLTDTVVSAKKDLQATKDGAANDENSWTADKTKYADQTTTDVEGAIKHLDELTSNDNSKKSDIEAARNDLQAAIKKVAAVRQKAVDNADAVVVKNGENTDVKKRVAAVKTAENTGTASDIAKAIAKLQTADATVVPTNIADDGDVAAAKVAVNKALNANDYKQADVDTAKQVYDNAVATAQATLKQAVTDANAVKVPANLQDQVEMAKKNKLGDVDQQVTDLHKAAGQDDTTASTLRSAMNDIQGSLDDMTTKLHTTRDAAQKLVDQTADATDTNVVAARKQVTNLLANNDTTTMTDLQNAMNVLTAMSKPATANTVETSSATVESDQVSTPVANGDAAFAIVTDANGKQTVVQLDKTENGTATANVPGATDAQVVTVPKNGNKPFIFVTDGSGTAQYTELTPNGVKTTITPDGTSTKTTDGKTLDVPADGDVTVMYLPTAEVSVQAGAKNVQVPGKTGYTATVTDAQGNEVTLTDGMIAVDGVPAGTNYLVTYTPDPAKVVMKLGTDSGFAKGEEPAAGNTNAQTLMTVQDALNKLQKDDATLAAIVSTGYTDTKVNVTNAVEALNRVDQNLNIDGYAHRIQAPDGTQYNSLEDAVKANPTFAAGTTQMKVVYAPLDGQKIQVKDADGNVLGTVMGKSDAEINVDDFKSVDADLQAKAEKGKLKMTVTAPDGKTYDSLMDALQATGYFDHVGLEDGPSSFDQSDAKFVATAWDETGKATAGYMVLGEPATPNDLNIQDFVVSFAPANDGAGHNNTNAGSKTGSSVAANNQNGDQVNVAGPANESRDGSEVNNATVAGQASGAQVAGSQIDATANTAQNAGWQAQGATQNSDNTASLLAAAGNEQQANTVNSDDARITEMPDSAAVIQDSILPLESAKQAMNLTGRVTEDNFLVVVAAMVASGLFGLLLAFWRRRKEDDQATR